MRKMIAAAAALSLMICAQASANTKQEKIDKGLGDKTTAAWLSANYASKMYIIDGALGVFVVKKVYSGPKGKEGMASSRKKLLGCVDFIAKGIQAKKSKHPVINEVVFMCGLSEKLISN